MNHEQAEKLLGALIFDDLDEQSKAQLLAYLETDEDLRETLADLRMALKVATDAVQHGPEPVLSDTHLKRLKQLSRSKTHPRVMVCVRWAAMAACIAIVAGLLLLPSLQKARLESTTDLAGGTSLMHETEFTGGTAAELNFNSIKGRANIEQGLREAGENAVAGSGLYVADKEGFLGKADGNGRLIADNTWAMKQTMELPVALEAKLGEQTDSSDLLSSQLDLGSRQNYGNGLVATNGDRFGAYSYSVTPPTSQPESDEALWARADTSHGAVTNNPLSLERDEQIRTGDTDFYARDYSRESESEDLAERVLGDQDGDGSSSVWGDSGAAGSHYYAEGLELKRRGLGFVDGRAAGSVDGALPSIKTESVSPSASRPSSARSRGQQEERGGLVLSKQLTSESARQGQGLDSMDEWYAPMSGRGENARSSGLPVVSKHYGRATNQEGMQKAFKEDGLGRRESISALGLEREQRRGVSSGEELSLGNSVRATSSGLDKRIKVMADGVDLKESEAQNSQFGVQFGYGYGGMGGGMMGGSMGGGMMGGAVRQTKSSQPSGDLALLPHQLPQALDAFGVGEAEAKAPVYGGRMAGKPTDSPEGSLDGFQKQLRETIARRRAESNNRGTDRLGRIMREPQIQHDLALLENDVVATGYDYFAEAEPVEKVPTLGDRPQVEHLFIRKNETSGRTKLLTSADEASSEFTLPPASRFKVMPVNPWVLTEQDALSTFALDVDTASYALCRQYIQHGFLPPVGAVRMEEFVNAFDYAYSEQSAATFSVMAEGTASPFSEPDQALSLVKVAVKARTVGRDQRKAAHLVFVVDASASMGQADRLPLIQEGLSQLVEKLGPGDHVSLVGCSDQAQLFVDHVSAEDRDTIQQAIHAIQPSGSTNLMAGLQLGYATARQSYVAGQINKVILCSDGVATVGPSEAEPVLDAVAADRKQGITLMCVGVGYGAYNDALLEALADRGDGSYVFIDSADKVERAFVTPLASALQTVAKDARIQVKFNPDRVRRYRLIGYENRDMKDELFRDDTVDAGEVGSGQCATALYEIELTGAPSDGGDLGTVFVRYQDTDTQQFEEIARPLTQSVFKKRTVVQAPRFYLAACAARFAEWLRQSEHAKSTTLDQIQIIMDELSAALPLDQDIRELADLIRQSEGLPRAP